MDAAQRYLHFWLPGGFTVTVTLASFEFDPYLVILGPDGWIIGQNDDSDWGPDAAVTWTTDVPGWYTAVVTSLGGTGRGEYIAWLSRDGAAVPTGEGETAGAPSGVLVPGVTVHGRLTGGDYGPGGEGSVAYTFAGEAGDIVSITLASDDFDPVLRLLDPSGAEIAYNDDADDSFAAQIVTELPSSGEYTAVATRWFGGTGAFTLLLEYLPELYVAEGWLAETDEGPSGDIYHDYRWHALPGATVEMWLTADFDAYLEVYDASGAIIAADDDSGGIWDARLRLEDVDGGVYRVRVTSSYGDGTGAYTLRLWSRTAGGEPGSAAPVAPAGDFETAVTGSGGGEAQPVPLAMGEMVSGELVSLDDRGRFVVELPEDGGTFDVWLFAELDLDLYTSLAGPISGWADAEDASEGVEGYEHVRVEALPGEGPLHILVAPYADPAVLGGAFWLLVQEGEAGAEPVPRWDAAPGVTARSPLAGRLEPGVVYSGELDTGRFDTQFWILEVPEGVERVRVGLLNADGDMDLSISHGWLPSAYGYWHDAYSITVRDNERISIGGPDDAISEVTPGVYTIAVWPGVAGPSSYNIIVTLDEPLPPSARYEPLDPSEIERLSPLRRAQLATVQLKNFAGTSSGTVVTPDGLILTNYHAVADCKVTGTWLTGCAATQSLDELREMEEIVSLTDEAKGYARQQFVAEVVQVLPEYDLALLEIVADIDGNPVGELRLPYFALDVRESGAVIGDEVIVVGYPDIVRLTTRTPLNVTRGILSGFTTHRDRRVFLQFDASIAEGSSGGALARSADGVLIGLPSNQTPGASQNYARPVSLVPEDWVELIVSRGGDVIR